MGPSIGQSFLVLGIITLAVGGLALAGWLIFRPRARRAITHQPGDSSKLPVVPQPHWLLEDNTLVRVGAVPRGGSTLTAVDMSTTKPLPAAAPELSAEAVETAPAAEPVPESMLTTLPLPAAEPAHHDAPTAAPEPMAPPVEPAPAFESVSAHEPGYEAYPVYVPEAPYAPESDAGSGDAWPAVAVLSDVHATQPVMPTPESAPLPPALAEPPLAPGATPPGEPEPVPSPDDTGSDAPELFVSPWVMPAAPDVIPMEAASATAPWLAVPAEGASPASEPETSWGAEAATPGHATPPAAAWTTPLPVVEPDATGTAAREEPPSSHGEPSPPAAHQPAVVLWLDAGSESQSS
jgi:nicotinate-nucleotide--dimethylbenzimidazole phosphoribosyltransferase